MHQVVKNKCISVEKSTFLLAQLEISERNYTDLKRICKSEGIFFPSYKDVSQYRLTITIANELIFIRNASQITFGIGLSYQSLLDQTISQILETLQTEHKFEFTIKISTLYHLYWLSSGQISDFSGFQIGDNYVIFNFWEALEKFCVQKMEFLGSITYM